MKFCPRFVMLSVLAAMLGFGEGYAQDIVFTDAEQILRIGNAVWFYEDATGQLTLDDVRDTTRVRFTRSGQQRPNFGNTRSAIWCRFTIVNRTTEACLLQIEKSLIHTIDFYKPDSSGRYTLRRVGALYPMSTREIRDNFFLFRLVAPETTVPQTFYIRFRSDESLEIPLSIGVNETIFEEHRSEEITFGIFYGIMLVMLVYNFFIFLIVRDRSYLYYALYLIAVLLLNDMMVCGLGFEFLWPETPRVNFYINALTGLVGAAVLKFSTEFLNTRQHVPALHRVAYFFYAFSALVAIANFAGEYFFSSIASQLDIFGISVYLIVVGIVSWRKGIKAARFYVVAWGLFLVSTIAYILFMNNLLPASYLIEHLTLLGTSVEAVLLSMALGDRINTLQKENQKAQAEKLDLIAQQNAILEKKVLERTYEIAAQNEEIAAQNEELVTQQDQIQVQNDQLQLRNAELLKAKATIEDQNHALKQYSENLEAEISVRARDLLETNQELVTQNHQLEQFAFITAHNLRAPVARIQGLASIIRVTDPGEREFILQKIEESSLELDNVIRDLAKILEVKKGAGQNLEAVKVQEKLDRVLNLLQDEIARNDARVDADFSRATHVHALPQYVESILYNLVSNALKYKSQYNAPLIALTTEPFDGYVRLTVTDNGLGFDLEKYGAKIFGLYQRFHFHIDGKGLGLYLVKTQVEALGGKVEIASEPGLGTTFFVDFPTRN